MSDANRPQPAEVTPIFESFQFEKEFGVIRVENWPEGIVLWVGGQIRWRSWREAEFCATRLPERKAAPKKSGPSGELSMANEQSQPTVDLHEIANRHSRECMAAIGREVVMGAAGWKFGKDPQAFIREAIVNSLRDAGVWDVRYD